MSINSDKIKTLDHKNLRASFVGSNPTQGIIYCPGMQEVKAGLLKCRQQRFPFSLGGSGYPAFTGETRVRVP